MAPPNTVNLNFYVLGEHRGHIMPISILRDTKNYDLRQIIIEEYKVVGDITQPVLFKTDRANDDLPKGPAPSLDTLLKFHDRVEMHWPAGSQIDETRVHILVKAKVTNGELTNPFKSFQDRQDATVKGFQNGDSASEAALLSEFIIEQGEHGKTPIFNGRPYNRTALPIQLFHPIFDTFTNALEDTEGLEPSRYAAVEELLHIAQDMYSTEEYRWEELQPCLIAALSTDIDEYSIPKCKADGVIKFIDPNAGLFAYCAIVEINNEIGTGKSDPSIQAAQSYARYWSEENLSGFRRMCCCPSLIIAVAGPWMCVLGAVFLDRVVVQPLTEYIWLGHHPQQDRRLVQVTRVFHALAVSIGELKTYYGSQRDRLLARPLTLTDPMRFFPHVRQYVNAAGDIVHFEYSGFMGDDSVVRPLFKAMTESGEEIVVKFAERYNIMAHKKLAAQGFAPGVLSHEAAPSNTGFQTIVMEHLHCVTLKEYLEPRPGMNASELETVRGGVFRALKILHGDGLVFGDLRAPNILVVEQDGGELHGMLVDFDWCGPENVARYPAGLNKGGRIQWAEGVEKGGLMRKQHDLDMFEKLFG